MTTRCRLHYAPDNASLVIRLALEELGLPYATALVDRGAAAQNGAAYRALNPHGLIPVLETPDGPLFETGAILLWLGDRHRGGAALAPAPESPERAPFLKWLFFTANTVHTELRQLFYPQKYIGSDPALQAQLRLTLQDRLATHLASLDAAAAGRPAWLGAAQPSALDCYLACLLRWMALYPADADRSWFRLADYPHLQAALARLEDRPSVRAAQAAEGLGPAPFTNPVYANPPEGSAT